MGLNLKMKKLAGGDSEPLIHIHTHTLPSREPSVLI